MKLVPEQVVGLRKAILDKRKSLDGYRDYLEENRTTTADDISRLRLGDSVTENSFNVEYLNAEKSLLMNQLSRLEDERTKILKSEGAESLRI